MSKNLFLVILSSLVFTAAFSKETNIAIVGSEDISRHLEQILKTSNINDYNITCTDSFKNVNPNTCDIVIYPDNDSTAVISKSMCRNTRFIKMNIRDSIMSSNGQIPCRTAIKNAENTSIIKIRQEHIDYLCSCCIYQTITGENILGNCYMPDFEKREEVVYTLQQCASEALKNPSETSVIDEHWYLQFFNSQWYGEKVVLLGDSITDKYQLLTDNDLYWHMLEKILGIRTFCYGINGHQMSNIIEQANRITDDFDAIIIFVGTNDYNANIPMGEWFNEEKKEVNCNGKNVIRLHREPIISDSTFKGRTNKVISTLKSRYPDKQIILLTPIHRSDAFLSKNNIQPNENYANQCGLFIDDYVNAIKEASSVWSVPVIDLFSLSGLYPEIESNGQMFFRHPSIDKETGFLDKLHPNTRGHIRIAYTMAFQMIALPGSFPEPTIK